MQDDMNTQLGTIRKLKRRAATAGILGVTAALFSGAPAFAGGFNSSFDGGWTLRKQICEWAPFWC